MVRTKSSFPVLSLIACVGFIHVAAANLFAQEEENEAAINVAIESLVKATDDADAEVRARAFTVLSRIPTDNELVIEKVRNSLASDDEETRKYAAEVLKQQPWDTEVKAEILIELLAQENIHVVREAANMFESSYVDGQQDKLLDMIRAEKGPTERRELYLSIVTRSSGAFPQVLSLLEELFDAAEKEGKIRIMQLIAKYGTAAKSGLPFLAEQLNDKDLQVRLTAIRCMEDIMTSRGRRRGRASGTNRNIEGRWQVYVDGLIKRYDSDGNGKLSLTERESISGSIQLDDVDGDGYVDRREAIDSVAGKTRSRRRTTQRGR